MENQNSQHIVQLADLLEQKDRLLLQLRRLQIRITKLRQITLDQEAEGPTTDESVLKGEENFPRRFFETGCYVGNNLLEILQSSADTFHLTSRQEPALTWAQVVAKIEFQDTGLAPWDSLPAYVAQMRVMNPMRWGRLERNEGGRIASRIYASQAPPLLPF